MESIFSLSILFAFLSIGDYTVGAGGSDFLINTSKCSIPNIPPFSPTLNFTRDPAVLCTKYDPLLSFTTVQDGIAKLHVRRDVIAKYFGYADSLSCCYRYVYRNGSETFPDEGITISACFNIISEAELNHDLVWILCSRLRAFSLFPVYENIHQVVTVPDSIKEKANRLKKSTTKKPISVLMIVIDSVSRLNFIRTMPNTRNFISRNNFYEFQGYNKVADNTFPNAMAFLTGLNYTDAIDICQPTEINGLMNCPFVWNKYRDLGYATAYGEDWSSIATFNYQKKGFKDQPTDYYFKPYMDAISYLETKWQATMPFCAGPETQGERILNIAYDFANHLKNLSSFGVFWMNTFSHNEIAAPATMDLKVKDFFEKLKSSHILDESIVIFLSDHGIRFGDIVNTSRGFYEVRLPMHYVSLPPWFKRGYPVETKNFEENLKKLTSNYDLYMTLQHILQLSGLNHTVIESSACPSCKSLFEKMPDERSCFEAGIPEFWCTCNVSITDKMTDW